MGRNGENTLPDDAADEWRKAFGLLCDQVVRLIEVVERLNGEVARLSAAEASRSETETTAGG